MNRACIPRTQLLALAITGFAATARMLPAQIRSPMSPTGIAPVSLSRSAASAAPGESFAMTLSSSVQSTPRTISDSTAGASQPYTGSVILTPTWDLNNNRQISIYAYVSQPFTSASGTLASSVLEASAIGGTGSANGAWSAFSSVVDGHISAVTLTAVTAHGAGKTVNDASERLTVSFRLNTTNTSVVPGLYTGVVTFGAYVQ
jgi:hypothetical protein